MSGFLLDTHVLLWSLDDAKQLAEHHREIIRNERSVFVSIATLWEVAIKSSLNKLAVPTDLHDVIHRAGYNMLGIELRHIAALESLPHLHRDPFDRMLIAQAQVEGFVLLSVDRHFSSYDVAVV